MSRHTGQTSSQSDSLFDELQLAVLTKRDKSLMHKNWPFKIAKYEHQDELKYPQSRQDENASDNPQLLFRPTPLSPD